MAITLIILCFIVLAMGLDNTVPHIALGQSAANFTSSLNKTQEWISQRDNVKILFTYQPERPIIDTFTKLELFVINLTNNENLAYNVITISIAAGLFYDLTNSLILSPGLAALGWVISDTAVFGNSLFIRKFSCSAIHPVTN